MPRRQVPLIAGQYYHVYNRGNNRGDIFFDRNNYFYLLQRFRECVANESAQVIAYVLMPNHYHFLLKALNDSLSGAMQKFSISYTKSINERFNRVGSLFQGAFEAKHVDNENYLRHLSRYIHLNPVRARICERPEQWEFSSYLEYVGRRNGTLPDLEPLRRDFEGNGYDRDQFAQHYAEYVSRYRSVDREHIAHLLFS
jgi:putative transposase